MRIVRGTFRLSMVLTALTVLYWLILAHSTALQRSNESHRLWSTLRCGQKILGKDTTHITNDFGNMDLSKIGCSGQSFFARTDEIEAALKEDDPSSEQYRLYFWSNLNWGFGAGFITFILVNLLGLLFFAILRVGSWILAGYKHHD